MTRDEVVNSLLEQAFYKGQVARSFPDGKFAEEEKALREAVRLLKAEKPLEHLEVRMMAKMDWKDPAREEAPVGMPLIITTKANWKKWPEVLGPVYRLQNAVNGGMEYVNFGAGAMIDSIENSVIGPNEVKVIAWDYWPIACEGTVHEKD